MPVLVAPALFFYGTTGRLISAGLMTDQKTGLQTGATGHHIGYLSPVR